MGNCCGGSGQNYSFVTTNEIRNDEWTNYQYKWRFMYESMEKYKYKLTIYSGVTFDENIEIRRQIISKKYKYNKLIINPLNGNFMILDQECHPLYFVINGRLLVICSQLTIQSCLNKAEALGYFDVINYCKSKLNEKSIFNFSEIRL